MTIEKEAREIWGNFGCHGDLSVIAKALQKKQDRIDKLEKEFDEYKTNNNSVKWNELLAKRMNQIGKLEERVREYKWEWESACERWRASNERVKELESALKELIEASKVAYTPKLVQSYAMKSLLKAFDRAKKAIGGGNEGD